MIIYTISDPETKEVRYVGKSAVGESRWKEHLKGSSLKLRTHKNNWLRSLVSKGLSPVFTVIETVESEAQLDAREIYWIAAYRDMGARLTNATNGGEGSTGRVLSLETRQKQSQKRIEYYSKLEVIPEPVNKKYHVEINGEKHKECYLCGKLKNIESFGKFRSRWDGLNPACKECHANRRKLNYIKYGK